MSYYKDVGCEKRNTKDERKTTMETIYDVIKSGR